MTNTQKDTDENTNILNGFTILRFSYAFSTGGCIEQYIADLDKTLSSHNKTTIIQMYLMLKGKVSTDE
ncbi:MAG: hypothetical protein J7L73_00185 [Anaerolineales bacterium]|nr:hypothetical protein [Anaerolineales bacterium]